jgi:hypothetical protein
MGTFCPLLKKDCIEHKCKFYVHLLGNDPQTGKGIDKFDCAVAFIPVLLIEGAQQTRQAGAAIESFRNEMVLGNQQTQRLLGAAAKRVQLPGGNGEAHDNPE